MHQPEGEGAASPSRKATRDPGKKATSENIIKTLMKERKVRGNYKDFVVIHAGSMMDYEGLYELTRNDNGERTQFQEIRLAHKRELIGFMHSEVAKLFWNSQIGMRVSKKARGDRLRRKEATGDGPPKAQAAEPAAV